MKTVQGHLQAVVDMIDRDEYCVDVMKQIAAVQSSLERVNRLLLQNHLETCLTESIRAGGGQHKIDELMEALKFTSSLTDFRPSRTFRRPTDEQQVAADEESECLKSELWRGPDSSRPRAFLIRLPS